VYSIAALLFECLAGRTPFDGDKPVAILVEKGKHDAPDVRSFEAACQVGAPLAAVLARALSRDAAQRPKDGRALGRALTQAALESGLPPSELGAGAPLLGGPGPARGEPTRALGTYARGSEEQDAARSALERPAERAPKPRRVGSSLGPAGVVIACFVVGALGALGIATQLGGCGSSWP
jgi:hypothetical protein